MDAPDEATGGSGNAASLAAAVLDEEAARQEAQARAKEQVIFPDDMLPGRRVGAGRLPRGVRQGRRAACSSILGLLISFDQLTLNAVQTDRARAAAARSTSARARSCSSAPRRACSTRSARSRWAGSPTA